MATLAEIFEWFKTGKKPTEAQFQASWSSFWHKEQPIPQSAVSNLIGSLNAKAEKSQFDAHKIDPDAHANLVTKARIIPIGQFIVFKVAPNENELEKESGDFCIGMVEGSLVMGEWNGGNDQLKTSYN